MLPDHPLRLLEDPLIIIPLQFPMENHLQHLAANHFVHMRS